MNFTRSMKHLLLCKGVSSNSQRCKSEKTSTSSYCVATVKQYDYENFICTLLLKNKARSCAFAVRAFNVEVARVSEQVSQPTIGLMRMKFWEEAIASCFSKDISKVPQNPVALEVFKAVTESNLSKRHFNSLIKSRQDRFTESIFPDLEAIEKHSEKSISTVYYLILEGCGVKNVNADHAASHLGKAQGIVQQLRCAHMAKKLKIIPLPQDILTKHKISHEEVFRSVPSDRLNDCSFEVASRAHQHLMKARSILKNVPVEGRAALLPAIAVENYLETLQKLNYNVLHPNLQKRSWGWVPKLWFVNLRNKY